MYEKFNIPTNSIIKKWVHKYEEFGVEVIIKQSKSIYDGNFKQNVVEYMHDNHLLATSTAYHFKLAEAEVILR